MQEILWQALEGFAAMPLWEWLAVFLGVGYIIAASKENLLAWVFGFFGTLIYTILFWNGSLLSSSILNFYYMVMSFYGFYLWSKKGENKPAVTVHSLTKKQFAFIIVTGSLSFLSVGYLFGEHFSAKEPYLDAFVFVFSLIATWMLAHKTLETWLLWMVVDSVGVVLYFKAGYYPTVLLFILYVILAVYGYMSWRKAKHEV